MRRKLRLLCASLYHRLRPKSSPESRQQQQQIKDLSDALLEAKLREQQNRSEYVERAHELFEARQMAGSGPWLSEGIRGNVDKGVSLKASLRETVASQASLADLELALESLEWRREINYSWLEFSRWGIQQIILLSRLYYIKNPLIQRGINVAAHYVFGRGVEVGSPDETADRILKDFFEENKGTLGQIALTDLERRKYYDGNLFFCFFPDTQSTGKVKVRTIDAVEIQDIVSDPQDSDTPWFYRRTWTQRVFDPATGQTATQNAEAWYPALGYEPAERPQTINNYPVYWESPILHRRCGAVAKWSFGCPLVYAALDWSKAARRYLENCATVKESLAQFSMTLRSKGGQQALEGIKQQMQTSAGPPTGIWDRNPPAVSGAIFASGTGTELQAFNTRGAGGDPEEVRRYILMVCAVFGFPETFFGDVQTGNLATAQSLDRPTELNFLEKQEAWREDLLTIAKYVLGISRGASGGMLREANKGDVVIVEARRVRKGHRVVMEASKVQKASTIEVTVNFPSILEGDVPALLGAIATAYATGVMDDKVTALQIYDLAPGVEDGISVAAEQYPGTVADRQKQKDDAAKALAAAPIAKVKPTEAVKLARRLVEAVAEERNGHG